MLSIPLRGGFIFIAIFGGIHLFFTVLILMLGKWNAWQSRRQREKRQRKEERRQEKLRKKGRRTPPPLPKDS